jgi:2-oxoisovalerate dehydrogenase E1 component alpha subunit
MSSLQDGRVRSDFSGAVVDGPLLEQMYYWMLLARRLNERMLILSRQGRAAFFIGGVGQEAAQVGAAMALRRGADYAAPYYRDLAINLVLGMTAGEAMLNVLAKRDDPNSYGRQMPAHWASTGRRIITQSSVVATQLLHAAGVALAAKMSGDPLVVLACCGEGSTSRGDFHESLNFSAIHRLPVLFFVENNGYAISESTDKEMPIRQVSDRALAYGMKHATVDGMDAVAVYETTSAAAAEAREGGGPYLIEARCYRLWPHSSDDDDRRYRSREEVAEWAKHDPLDLFRSRCEVEGTISPERFEEIDSRVTEEVGEATQWALMQPDPEPTDALGFVFKEDADDE